MGIKAERTAAGTLNPLEDQVGSVGPALPGVELKLADDGEVLLRSESVMMGYRNMPQETSEAIDNDNWLHTGDIGSFDDDGYLTIIDRKKDVIINASGKNMAPSKIEGAIKSACSLIGQICLIGDRRHFNTALILLEPDFAPAWAAQNGLENESLIELASNEQLIAAIQAGVDAGNEKLARVEQVKKFTILSDQWVPGGNELTPTMKLRRKAISDRYVDVIDEMYAS